MRQRAMLLSFGVLVSVMIGCNTAPQAPSAPPPRQQFTIPRRSVEEIGRNSFGTAYQSARVVGATAQFEYVPKLDDTPQSNYKRIFSLGAGAVTPTFRDERGVQTIRLTALDPGQPGRRLVVWSLSRDVAKTIPWQHLPPIEDLTKIVKIEYQDKTFANAAALKGR